MAAACRMAVDGSADGYETGGLQTTAGGPRTLEINMLASFLS